jgi:hypothetical protein
MSHMTPEERLLDLIKKAQGSLKMKKELRIFTKVNIILAVLIIVVFGIFISDVFRSGKKKSMLKADLSKIEAPSLPEVVDAKEPAEEETDKTPVPPPGKELISGLNLLGIITGSANQAIVEDKKTDKTYFLYQGDVFGDFKVFSISTTGVILDYQGEKIELKI